MRLIITLLIIVNSLVAQTISTTTVTWSTGWCNICGPTTGNYACETGSGSGNWNNGVRTFMDPTPVGHSICAVYVQVNKVDCGLTSMCVLLNGVTIQCQPVGVGSNCSCGACWPQTYQMTQCPFPSYIKGGINTLDLNPVGNLCVSSAVITLFSNPTCTGSCVMILPLEEAKEAAISTGSASDYKPKIDVVTDILGTNYGDSIPKDYKGVLFIRYKNGDFRKILRNE